MKNKLKRIVKNIKAVMDTATGNAITVFTKSSNDSKTLKIAAVDLMVASKIKSTDLFEPKNPISTATPKLYAWLYDHVVAGFPQADQDLLKKDKEWRAAQVKAGTLTVADAKLISHERTAKTQEVGSKMRDLRRQLEVRENPKQGRGTKGKKKTAKESTVKSGSFNKTMVNSLPESKLKTLVLFLISRANNEKKAGYSVNEVVKGLTIALKGYEKKIISRGK